MTEAARLKACWREQDVGASLGKRQRAVDRVAAVLLLQSSSGRLAIWRPGPVVWVRIPSAARAAPGGTAGAAPDAPAAGEAGDEELAVYNAYLARLHSEARGHGRWHGLR